MHPLDRPRPRTIYVLYPVENRRILCKGSILPYYEFKSPKPMTDAEWKAMLDSEQRVPVPAWFEPVLGEQGLSGRVEKK